MNEHKMSETLIRNKLWTHSMILRKKRSSQTCHLRSAEAELQEKSPGLGRSQDQGHRGSWLNRHLRIGRHDWWLHQGPEPSCHSQWRAQANWNHLWWRRGKFDFFIHDGHKVMVELSPHIYLCVTVCHALVYKLCERSLLSPKRNTPLGRALYRVSQRCCLSNPTVIYAFFILPMLWETHGVLAPGPNVKISLFFCMPEWHFVPSNPNFTASAVEMHREQKQFMQFCFSDSCS